MEDQLLLRLCYKWALKNAYDYDGKAQTGPVISKVISENREAKDDIKRLMEVAQRVVEMVNALPYDEIVNALTEIDPTLIERRREEKRDLPPLPGAVEGAVVTRLPPEPSGFMHIGHAMSGLVNYLYKERYRGELWLRFEDTDPRKAKLEYYENFREGYRWLGIEWDREKNNSDDMEVFYAYCKRLLESGEAYACSCDQPTMRAMRARGIPCVHRSLDVSLNLEVWDGMLENRIGEGEATIRFKGDVSSQNTALRDPVLFRVIESDHPITGDRYRVWPTYDFAVSVEDGICGVTHVLRTSEFRLRDELQNEIRRRLGLRNPLFIEYARFEFEGVPVAKREIRDLIERRVISGWDDVRLVTVSALKRRGIRPEAIKEFVRRYVAFTEAKKEFSWDLLNAVNRRVLDPMTPRLFFVPNPVTLVIRNFEVRGISIPLHPMERLGERHVQLGERFYIPGDDASSFEAGTKFRLKYLCNVIVDRIEGPTVYGSCVMEGPEPGIRIVQWVSEPNIKVRVLIPGPLFLKDGTFNDQSLRVVEGFAEPYVANLREHDTVQFERFGYCTRDSHENTFILTHE
ncbi:MAG: glutamate--tRNA ligase [Aigarchaeota archaeon]|nr:glutamate--tRNA ligase [Aigarchaeota archaeon]MDW8092891.1 glutamate--tRNA ligase [Nitrososphaerota archaeon]